MDTGDGETSVNGRVYAMQVIVYDPMALQYIECWADCGVSVSLNQFTRCWLMNHVLLGDKTRQGWFNKTETSHFLNKRLKSPRSTKTQILSVAIRLYGGAASPVALPRWRWPTARAELVDMLVERRNAAFRTCTQGCTLDALFSSFFYLIKINSRDASSS